MVDRHPSLARGVMTVDRVMAIQVFTHIHIHKINTILVVLIPIALVYTQPDHVSRWTPTPTWKVRNQATLAVLGRTRAHERSYCVFRRSSEYNDRGREESRERSVPRETARRDEREPERRRSRSRDRDSVSLIEPRGHP